jgi:hypothetical protein
MGLLGQFLDVKRIHQLMNRNEDFGLFIFRVDALRDCHNPNAEEFQPLIRLSTFGAIAGEAARIVD